MEVRSTTNIPHTPVQEKRQHARSPRAETDMDSTTSSPASDTDKLSFAAATAMLMAPLPRHDDDQDDALLLGLPFFFGDDDSSDSHDSIKTEDGGAEIMEHGRRAMTPEQRRVRRNLKERERIQNVKARIETLRLDVAQLIDKHDAMKKKLEQRVMLRASSDDDIQAQVSAYLTQAGAPADTHDAALLQEYLKLEKETQQLQLLKCTLEDQLRPKAAQTAALTAVLGGDPVFEREVTDANVLTSASLVSSASAPLGASPPSVRMDPVTLLEAMLADDPLTPDEARGFVEDACREMMEGLARRDWVEGFEGFGWRGSRRVDADGVGLQFRLSQTFPSVSASVLVEKTWHMLTNREAYQRIQPPTQQLRVIQRINDECWVIGLHVGKERARVGQVLVARAIIHGGFLVTFRSLPLSRKKGLAGSERAQQRFVEAETGGMYVSIQSWYNFQERPNATGGVDCEVIFGGTSHNGDRHYLKELQTEVVAGITRWQTALGFSSFFLSSSTIGGDSG